MSCQPYRPRPGQTPHRRPVHRGGPAQPYSARTRLRRRGAALLLAGLLSLGSATAAAKARWKLHPSAEDVGARYASLDGEASWGAARSPARLMVYCRSLQGPRVLLVFPAGEMGFDIDPYTGDDGLATRKPLLGLSEGKGKGVRKYRYHAKGYGFREDDYALEFHPRGDHLARWIADEPDPARLLFRLPDSPKAVSRLEFRFMLPAGKHQALRKLLGGCEGRPPAEKGGAHKGAPDEAKPAR